MADSRHPGPTRWLLAVHQLRAEFLITRHQAQQLKALLLHKRGSIAPILRAMSDVSVDPAVFRSAMLWYLATATPDAGSQALVADHAAPILRHFASISGLDKQEGSEVCPKLARALQEFELQTLDADRFQHVCGMFFPIFSIAPEHRAEFGKLRQEAFHALRDEGSDTIPVDRLLAAISMVAKNESAWTDDFIKIEAARMGQCC